MNEWTEGAKGLVVPLESPPTVRTHTFSFRHLSDAARAVNDLDGAGARLVALLCVNAEPFWGEYLLIYRHSAELSFSELT